MNELQIFQNEEFGTIKKHVDEEDKILIKAGEMPTLKTSNFGAYVINESGLYSLVLSSKLPNAKKFKRWVTSEVLPSIRKNGGYLAGQESMSNEELMARALLMAQNTIAEREKRIQSLQAQNELKDQIIADFEPIRTYVDTILESPGTMSTAQIAADYDITPQKLNKILHEERVQRKVNGQWILYKSYMGQGYTKSKTFQFTHSDGRRDSRMQTQWTQKGRLMIHEILKARGIIPAADQRNEVA